VIWDQGLTWLTTALLATNGNDLGEGEVDTVAERRATTAAASAVQLWLDHNARDDVEHRHFIWQDDDVGETAAGKDTLADVDPEWLVNRVKPVEGASEGGHEDPERVEALSDGEEAVYLIEMADESSVDHRVFVLPSPSPGGVAACHFPFEHLEMSRRVTVHQLDLRESEIVISCQRFAPLIAVNFSP